MKEHYLLTILSEDRKGLVSIITGILNRRGTEIESVSAARTDIHWRVLVTLEVITESSDIKIISNKIKNIIEVFHVEIALIQDAWYQKVALYTIDKSGYNSEIHCRLQKFGAVIVGYFQDEILIQKTGRDEDILLLYNDLDGPYLKSFTKSAAISIKPIADEDSSVMSLAA